MSKFDYARFYGSYDELAVNKEKYTKEQAIEIAKVELERNKKPYYIAVGDGYVRHRAGVNEDCEPCVGWWLEYSEHKRSCPCWVCHVGADKNELFSDRYEYILISKESDTEERRSGSWRSQEPGKKSKNPRITRIRNAF